MSTLAPSIETLADLLDRLGAIPPGRIRFQPFPGTAAEADVVTQREQFDLLCELVDGVLVEKAMGFYEARVASYLGRVLDEFAEHHDLGFTVGADGAVRLTTGLIRIPDVSFFSWSQFPDRVLPTEPLPDLAPRLAVEVLSANNTAREMARKRREYFAAGVKLVWEIDPSSRSAYRYTAPEQSTVIREDDELEGGELLPGFRIRLGELFARAGRRSPEARTAE